jgi:hypothetical protein
VSRVEGGTEDIQARPPLADRLLAACDAFEGGYYDFNGPPRDLLAVAREAAGEITRLHGLIDEVVAWCGVVGWTGPQLPIDLARRLAVLGPLPPTRPTLAEVEDLLSPEQRAGLHADLAEMAKQRRQATDAAGDVTLGGLPPTQETTR